MTAAVHDQRNGRQRQQLIKQVERHQVGRASNAQRHAEAHGVEAEKAVFAFLFFHVFKCVERAKRPEPRNDGGEHPTHTIQLKGNGQRFGDVEKRFLCVAAPENLVKGQHKGDGHRDHDIDPA